MTTRQPKSNVLDDFLLGVHGDLMADDYMNNEDDLDLPWPWHEIFHNDTLLAILNLTDVVQDSINDIGDSEDSAGGGGGHRYGMPRMPSSSFPLPHPPPARNTSGSSSVLTSFIDHGSCGDATSFYYVDLTQITSIHHAFVLLYAAVIALSIVGNVMVVVAVWRHKHMRTVTNCYIANLAVCDLLVSLVVMPLKLLEYAAPCHWNVFNTDALCSLVSYVLPVFVFASVLTLVATSVERYYAIVHPLSSVTDHSKSRTRRVIIAVWIVPMILALPYLYHQSFSFHIHSEYGRIERQICQDRFDDIDAKISSRMGAGEGLIEAGTFRKWFFVVLFLVMYALPSLVITVTCIQIARCLFQPIGLEPLPSDRQSSSSSFRGMKIRRRKEENKRKVARMIIAVSVVFLLCWTPHYVVSIVSQLQAHSFLRHSNFVFTMLATHLVGFLNSCINPMIYNSMSEKFRNGFRLIICRLCCSCVTSRRRRRRQQEDWKMRSDYGGTEMAPGGVVKRANDINSSYTAAHEYARLRRQSNNNKMLHQLQRASPGVDDPVQGSTGQPAQLPKPQPSLQAHADDLNGNSQQPVDAFDQQLNEHLQLLLQDTDEPCGRDLDLDLSLPTTAFDVAMVGASNRSRLKRSSSVQHERERIHHTLRTFGCETEGSQRRVTTAEPPSCARLYRPTSNSVASASDDVALNSNSERKVGSGASVVTASTIGNVHQQQTRPNSCTKTTSSFRTRRQQRRRSSVAGGAESRSFSHHSHHSQDNAEDKDCEYLSSSPVMSCCCSGRGSESDGDSKSRRFSHNYVITRTNKPTNACKNGSNKTASVRSSHQVTFKANGNKRPQKLQPQDQQGQQLLLLQKSLLFFQQNGNGRLASAAMTKPKKNYK